MGAIELQRIGAAIAVRRKSIGLTQTELAARLGVTHQAVSKWERGACAPELQNLVDLSALFDVCIHTLLALDGKCPDVHPRPCEDAEYEAGLLEGQEDGRTKDRQECKSWGNLRESVAQEEQQEGQQDEQQAGQVEREQLHSWSEKSMSPAAVTALWQLVLDDLRRDISKPSFDTWLRPTIAVWEDERLTVVSPSKSQNEWIHARYGSRIVQAVETASAKGGIEVAFRTARPGDPPVNHPHRHQRAIRIE